MTAALIISLVLLLSAACCALMIYKLTKTNQKPIKRKTGMVLGASGIIAFVADTVGIGSFAVNIALFKVFKVFQDEQLPAVVNGAQVIPGALESIIFIQKIQVDLHTLILLTAATCLGGILGGMLASYLRARFIQIIMMIAFSGIVLLLLGNIFSITPIGGSATFLGGWKLILGCMGLFFAGFLVAFGVGLFAMVESVLFLLGMSPLVAFPIMTTAGALQQPLTTTTFILADKMPLKPVLIISVFGIIGVFLGLSVISYLSTTELHWSLVIILLFNVYRISKNFFSA